MAFLQASQEFAFSSLPHRNPRLLRPPSPAPRASPAFKLPHRLRIVSSDSTSLRIVSSHSTNIAPDHSSPTSSAHADPTAPLLDRRHLLTAASIASVSLLSSPPPPSLASPVVPPDLNKCGLATVSAPPGSTGATSEIRCCIPVPIRPIIDFRFEKHPQQRFRRPAHLVNAEYVAKYNKAYQLMRDLPVTDPRSLRGQADMHCAFCNGAYTQQGSTNKLQIHFSWLFLPWHRWYLYFHERILAKLIGDPTFGLVFWNWDNQTGGGNKMPAMFTTKGSALYDSKRNQAHLPPVLDALNIASLSGSVEPNSQIVQDNLNIMYQSMVTASTPNLFMGKKYSAGDAEPNVGGTLENSPHTAIHAWTGDNRETYGEDMGNFYSAARDPIFFAHHSNVDRLWTVWNTIGGRRRDHTDPDFLNAEFVFYDENADMVRVTVRDALDSSKLGVAFEPVKADRLWLTYEPRPLSAGGAAPSAEEVPEIGPAAKNEKSTEVKKKLVCRATRSSEPPKELLEKGLKEDELEEVLVLEDVQVPRNIVTHLAVFINLPDADDKTPLTSAEYVGSFISIPHFKGADMMDMRSSNIRFGITDNIKRLGITDLSSLTVTVVTKYPGAEELTVTIKGIKIEYE